MHNKYTQNKNHKLYRHNALLISLNYLVWKSQQPFQSRCIIYFCYHTNDCEFSNRQEQHPNSNLNIKNRIFITINTNEFVNHIGLIYSESHLTLRNSISSNFSSPPWIAPQTHIYNTSYIYISIMHKIFDWLVFRHTLCTSKMYCLAFFFIHLLH